MFRWTSVTPTYDSDGVIIEYNIAVDGKNEKNESVYGQITLKPEDLDLSEVGHVSKDKLIKMLQEQPE